MVKRDPTNGMDCEYPMYGFHFAEGAEKTCKNGKGMYSVEFIYATHYVRGKDVEHIRRIVGKGFRVILRIDYTRGGQTVPAENDWEGRKRYAELCRQIAQDMGDLVDIYVIGNEMSSPHEGKIPSLWYAYVFNAYDEHTCYKYIKSVRPDSIVCAGALSGWQGFDHEPNSNINYLKTIMDTVEAVDGFAVHAYSGWRHWDGSGDIDDPRFAGHIGMGSFRAVMRKLYERYGTTKPVFITETNTYWNLNPEAPTGYSDQNYRAGWMQEAYQAFDQWNRSNDLKVYALCWFTYSTLGITDPHSDIFTDAIERTDNARLNQAREDYSWLTANTHYIPGCTGESLHFEAENFSNSELWNHSDGVEGTDYHVISPRADDCSYRKYSQVDLAVLSGHGEFAVQNLQAGEWLRYTTLAGGKDYKLTVRYANAGVPAVMHVEIDGQIAGGQVALEPTAGADTYIIAYGGRLHLPAGYHEIRLMMEQGTANIDWFELERV